MRILVLSFLIFALSACSFVTEQISLEQQLPLIARIDQLYTWTFSRDTFNSSNGDLRYSATLMPGWLSFDPASRTFRGTPTASDEGSPRITVIATDASGSTASSSTTICVTHFPPPSLNTSISKQLNQSNPSMSSVFDLALHSAISTPNPAIRIPPKWSFSIGFDGHSYSAQYELFYQVLLANGSPLPPWMSFHQKTCTLNGYTPDDLSNPVVRLAFHASDQEGYTADIQFFDLVIAAHELSMAVHSLPTINVTAATPFNVGLVSPADFTGVLVDNKPIHPSNISNLSVDTSQYSWLQWSEKNRILSGNPGPYDGQAQGPTLSAVIETTFNQSIKTNVSLAVVPSYFTTSNLSPIQAAEDGSVRFNLVPYFSNATVDGQRKDVDLTASYEPPDAGLSFDTTSALLTGKVSPLLASSANHMIVTFTAYSHVTHSTSHTTLVITIPPSQYKKEYDSRRVSLSPAARRKLTLGLAITFGVIGGLCFAGVFLAAFRHCARVQDTALDGEAGMNAWTDKEKKWYGIGGDTNSDNSVEHGYKWTEGEPSSPEKSRHVTELQGIFELPSAAIRKRPEYGNIGLGVLHNVSSSASQAMSKREFVAKIKNTVRQVSDQCQRIRRGQFKRPVIGKPMQVGTSQVDGLPGDQCYSNPFDDIHVISYHGSTLDSLRNSPSSSTGEQSIPRRRADFAPPRSPALVHFTDSQSARPHSTGSTGSLASDSSVKTHAAEAVVQTAARATSVKNGMAAPRSPETMNARPRLVPFTSSTRVPVPRVPSSNLPGSTDENGRPLGTSKRVASQKAMVWKSPSEEVRHVQHSTSGDELSVGIHYVRTLGADQQTVLTNPSTPTVSTNMRSSFSSLESSHHGHGGSSAGGDMQRILVRAGQKFHFRMPVHQEASPRAYTRGCQLLARLVSGPPLPMFLRADMSGGQRGCVEFYGVPTAQDIGEFEVGVYTEDGERMARVFVEVVGRS